MGLETIIVLLSFTCTLLLYLVRYSSTIIIFPLMTFMYERMQEDYDEVKNNPVELQLLLEDSIMVNRIVYVYFFSVCIGGLSLLATLGLSSFGEPEMQLHYLSLLGFVYKETSLLSFFSCWHIICTTVYGLMVLTVTEAGLMLISTHTSGLLKIAKVEQDESNDLNNYTVSIFMSESLDASSFRLNDRSGMVIIVVGFIFLCSTIISKKKIHRLKTAIEAVAFSSKIKEFNIVPAISMHRRAINFVHKYVTEIEMTILCMVPLSIVGGGVNLYRFHMNVTNYTDKDALMLSIHFVIAYLTFCFGDNYSGQVMLNASADYYDATYDTLWYLLPPKMQKMVLFTIMKCQLFLELNCGGLYLVSNEGSARMASTAFSYFTLLCSML